MGIFSQQKSYLGIDIGTSSIKIVELKNEKGRSRLMTYGYCEVENVLLREESVEAQKKIAALIRKILYECGASSKKVITALPVHAVFSSIINLPQMKKKDLSQAIRWEAKKVIPMPLEEMILDWKLLEEKKDSGTLKKDKEERKIKHIQVLLTSAPKALVQNYINIFKQAKLSLLSLETEVFALIRSLVGNDPSVIMLVDIGAFVTSISVVENGIPQLSRNIEVGGESITQLIARKTMLSYEQAEQFKFDLSIDSGQEEKLPPYLEAGLSSVINEIKYSYNLYQNQSEKKIDKVILTGGSALLKGIASYLSSLLNTKVYLGDPWARVIYPEELRSILDMLGARFAVAVGLAMREIE